MNFLRPSAMSGGSGSGGTAACLSKSGGSDGCLIKLPPSYHGAFISSGPGLGLSFAGDAAFEDSGDSVIVNGNHTTCIFCDLTSSFSRFGFLDGCFHGGSFNTDPVVSFLDSSARVTDC
ncbi:hypothetical protein P8452_70086 [Trifolium repens]|nr:hypothetical protein P8452_70086 [Trifolium repens]